MKRFLIPTLPAPGQTIKLPKSEEIHAASVLRLRDNEAVELIDGSGCSLQAIVKCKGKVLQLEIPQDTVARQSSNGETLPVELAISVLKGKAFELVIEKSVELGVKKLTPIITDHTVFKLNKNPIVIQERWQKIADQSLKQCGRLMRMSVELPVLFINFFNKNNPGLVDPEKTTFWCDEESTTDGNGSISLLNWFHQNQKPKNIRLLIGPEGGWSASERKQLSTFTGSPMYRINLGPVILRADTAAIVSIGIVTNFFRSMPS